MIHDGFKRKRSDGFMTSVIPSAREGTDVEDLLFQSGIESMNFLIVRSFGTTSWADRYTVEN